MQFILWTRHEEFEQLAMPWTCSPSRLPSRMSNFLMYLLCTALATRLCRSSSISEGLNSGRLSIAITSRSSSTVQLLEHLIFSKCLNHVYTKYVPSVLGMLIQKYLSRSESPRLLLFHPRHHASIDCLGDGKPPPVHLARHWQPRQCCV